MTKNKSMSKKKDLLLPSLDKSDKLLKEIHHRIKNNLQVIISLLKLQSYHSHEVQTISVLNKIYNRIRSIGIAYDLLDNSKNFSCVELSVYIKNLVNSLSETHLRNGDAVRVSVDVEDITIDIDKAILCGMIINELVSNAFKYAFPRPREGQISVQIHTFGNKYVLTVADNGTGIPEKYDFDVTESLGLKIVRILAKQLDATVAVDRKAGTLFTIQFLSASQDR